MGRVGQAGVLCLEAVPAVSQIANGATAMAAMTGFRGRTVPGL